MPDRPSPSSHHKPNWLGKPAAQMRADAAVWRDQEPVTESCLFCDWRWVGLVAAGRDAAKAHRADKHPEAVGRRTYRKPAGFKVGSRVGDDVIEGHRRARLEREEAERLARLERRRVAQEAAA